MTKQKTNCSMYNGSSSPLVVRSCWFFRKNQYSNIPKFKYYLLTLMLNGSIHFFPKMSYPFKGSFIHRNFWVGTKKYFRFVLPADVIAFIMTGIVGCSHYIIFQFSCRIYIVNCKNSQIIRKKQPNSEQSQCIWITSSPTGDSLAWEHEWNICFGSQFDCRQMILNQVHLITSVYAAVATLYRFRNCSLFINMTHSD